MFSLRKKYRTYYDRRPSCLELNYTTVVRTTHAQRFKITFPLMAFLSIPPSLHPCYTFIFNSDHVDLLFTRSIRLRSLISPSSFLEADPLEAGAEKKSFSDKFQSVRQSESAAAAALSD